ncbi:lipoprotein NlpI [Phycisphaerae bacterium RAS1]|nr:lipoprotein NlpI [Phycisphaerae bacterium RAS1]
MNPDEIESALGEVGVLLEKGQAAEALQRLDEVDGQLADTDDRIEAASLRAWALSELDRTEEALDLLEPLLEQNPDAGRLYGALGIVLSNSDNLDEARKALETALEIDPHDEAAIANLGLVYEKMHDGKQAIQLYDRAIDMGVDIDWALQRKAAAQIELGDYDGAKGTLKRYLSLAPDDTAQWISLAILHSDDREYEQATACYEQAERLDGSSPALRMNWGVTAVREGRTDAAERQLAELRQIEPDSIRCRLLQAMILEQNGRTREATRCYESALAEADAQYADDRVFALELAMDYFVRHNARTRCEELFRTAYAENTCTVEICEAYRELTGRRAKRAAWYSLVLEGDWRPGLSQVYERGAPREGPFTRFLRNYQVVACDRDEAVSLSLDFARRMGETGLRVREFVGDEGLQDAVTGIYEVERDALVIAGEPPTP